MFFLFNNIYEEADLKCFNPFPTDVWFTKKRLYKSII